MTKLLALYRAIVATLDRQGDWLLPSLARLVFAAVLLGYFWTSALTKFDGVLTPSVGGFAQIYPRAFEALGYDPGQVSLWQYLVVLLGAYAEVILPALIVLGLFSRLAALGMLGFVAVQSLTDIYGHGAASGAWFDHTSDSLILDQRAFWVLALVVILVKGAGPLALDPLFGKAKPRLTA